MHLALFLLQRSPDPDAVQKMMTMMPLIFGIIMVCVVIGLAIVIVPFWFICKKAGFSPWLSLLNIIPLGNLILIYVLAFADWKVMPVPQAGWPVPPQYPPYPPQA